MCMKNTETHGRNRIITSGEITLKQPCHNGCQVKYILAPVHKTAHHCFLHVHAYMVHTPPANILCPAKSDTGCFAVQELNIFETWFLSAVTCVNIACAFPWPIFPHLLFLAKTSNHNVRDRHVIKQCTGPTATSDRLLLPGFNFSTSIEPDKF